MLDWNGHLGLSWLGAAKPTTLEASKRSRDGLTDRMGRRAASALLAEARAALARGDRVRAVVLLERALGHAVNDLGLLWKAAGAHAEATACYEKALELADADVGLRAAALNNLGEVDRASGRLGAAEERFTAALQLLEGLEGSAVEASARITSNLGLVYEVQARYARAVEAFERALALAGAATGDASTVTNLMRVHLAFVHADLARYDVARPLLEQAVEALRARREPDAVAAYGAALSGLATLHTELASYNAAERYYEQVLDLLLRRSAGNDRDFARALDNLARVRYLRGDLGGAARLYRAAHAVWQKRPADSADLATNLEGLAVTLADSGDSQSAASLHSEALRLREHARGADHPDVALSLFNLAVTRMEERDYGGAERLYRRAEEIVRAKLPANHPFLAEILMRLIEVLAATERRDEALGALREVAAITTELIAHASAATTERELLRYLQDVIANSVYALLSLVHHAGGRVGAADAFELTLRRKAVAAELLALEQRAVAGTPDPVISSLLLERNAVRRAFSEQAWAVTEHDGAGHLEERLDELDAELGRGLPLVDIIQRLSSVGTADVANALPMNAALVEFVRAPVLGFGASSPRWQSPHYFALTMRKQSPDDVALIDLGPAQPIEGQLAGFLTAVAVARGSGVPEGRPVREALFDPLVPHLVGCKRVILAPDGELTKLPFEILPADDVRRLIDDYTFSYVAVSRDLLLPLTAPRGADRPLVVADPDFDLAEHDDETLPLEQRRRPHDLRSHLRPWRRLQLTQLEGREVAERFAVPAVLGRAAVQSVVLNATSPRILHVATHGFFLPDLPLRSENPMLRSGLALAGMNRTIRGEPAAVGAGDGVLTAEEVMALDLAGTELVVLSACATGLGRIVDGQGVFGLRRAFALAGAETVVMSLWDVPTLHTQRLMKGFYDRLADGDPVVDALRESQLQLKARWKDPFYWGGFICHGRGRRLAATFAQNPAARSDDL